MSEEGNCICTSQKIESLGGGGEGGRGTSNYMLCNAKMEQVFLLRNLVFCQTKFFNNKKAMQMKT